MPTTRAKVQRPPRVKGPVAPVETRYIKPVREWTFADLATSLQRSARAKVGGQLDRVRVLGPGCYEIES